MTQYQKIKNVILKQAENLIKHFSNEDTDGNQVH